MFFIFRIIFGRTCYGTTVSTSTARLYPMTKTTYATQQALEFIAQRTTFALHVASQTFYEPNYIVFSLASQPQKTNHNTLSYTLIALTPYAQYLVRKVIKSIFYHSYQLLLTLVVVPLMV